MLPSLCGSPLDGHNGKAGMAWHCAGLYSIILGYQKRMLCPSCLPSKPCLLPSAMPPSPSAKKALTLKSCAFNLAHAVKDANGTAYNRTKHLPERKKMMQAWADYLDTLRAVTSGDNVVTANFHRAV